uniref:E4 n=1 Tax=Human papillomavirus 62 TaxID=334210 RepID=A0A7G2A7G0_HPV62|nr:E4 [human papillomavirus 62]
MNHATLYLAPRTLCERYPLLKLLDCYTPPNPPPVPSTWAPPRPPKPPRCRRRLVSDSESTDTERSGSPQLQKRTAGSWTITSTGPTVTLTAQKDDTCVTVALHL